MLTVTLLHAYASASPAVRRTIKAVAAAMAGAGIALLAAACSPAHAHLAVHPGQGHLFGLEV